jgi:hypothetical protein
MSTLYLELGSDFVLTPSGSLLMASGWDEVRQRIERLIFTNAAGFQSDGTPILAQYIFDPAYGLSAGARVGDLVTNPLINEMTSIIYQGILADPGVDPTQPPVIQVSQPSFEQLLFVIGVTLLDGSQQTLTLLAP